MSKKTNLLVTIPFDEKLLNTIRAVSSHLEVRVSKARTAEGIPAELWRQTDVLYSGGILPPLDLVPNLKWIQFHFAGIDSLANAPILQQAGIAVTTLSGAHAPQMGEYVVMMLLALGHKLPHLFTAKEKAEWASDRFTRFQPVELRGSTVGIIGYGSIGREVARLLQPFGVTVLATKWNAMQPQDTGYTQEGLGDPLGDFPRRIYPFQALQSMTAECDFLVVAVPLTEATRGLISAETFAVMKPSTFIVDVSRGGVLDHIALIRALKDKKIAGAALDVFPEEPLPPNSPLWKFPNVILSPHISGGTPHYDQRAVALFVQNLRRYLAGKALYNAFTPERGY